jgi:hypothetical protein
VLDSAKIAEPDSFGPSNILWSGTIPWPVTVGPRRLVIREYEKWQNGEKEVFCNVLDL